MRAEAFLGFQLQYGEADRCGHFSELRHSEDAHIAGISKVFMSQTTKSLEV